jgi:hypothetical protein
MRYWASSVTTGSTVSLICTARRAGDRRKRPGHERYQSAKQGNAEPSRLRIGAAQSRKGIVIAVRMLVGRVAPRNAGCQLLLVAD